MVLEIGGHLFTSIQTSLEFGVSDVSRDYNGAVKVDSGAYRILGELGPYGIDSLVQVYDNTFGTLSRTTILLRNKFRGIGILFP